MEGRAQGRCETAGGVEGGSGVGSREHLCNITCMTRMHACCHMLILIYNSYQCVSCVYFCVSVHANVLNVCGNSYRPYRNGISIE